MKDPMRYIRFLLIPLFLLFGTQAWPQEEMQDLATLEKELEETSKAIDEYVSTLSPEEQEEFNKAVEEVTEMIENMSEEEFTQFLGEAFGEELPLEEPVEKEVEVEEEKEEIPIPEPVVKEEKGKQSQAISLIDAIITHTNSFVVKIASSPDLPGKIEYWGKQGTIKEWPSTLEWKDFKLQLESFSQKLYKMKDIDPQTKKYKYIDDFIKDEALYNNLSQLKRQVTNYEPNIEIPEFGLEKLSTESKQATQKVANAYTEALYILKIPQALEKLFEEYEPVAKKVRAEEEAAEKKAAALAKKKPTPERALVAGREAEGADFGYPRTPAYRPPAYPTYTPSAYAPTYKPSKREEPTDFKKSGKPTKPRSGKSEKPAPTEEKFEGVSQVLEKKDHESEKMLWKIEADLKKIAGMIEKNEKFKNIQDHLTSDEPVDHGLAVIDIPPIKRLIRDVISDIKALKRKVQLLGPVSKKYYKEELQSLVDKYKEPLKEIADSVNAIQKKIETDAAFTKSVSDEKKYAYLGDEQAISRIQKRAPGEKTIKDDIPHPTSLYELKDEIENLIKTAKDFAVEKKPKARPGTPR